MDSIVPEVIIISPVQGAPATPLTVNGTITFSGTASDANGITIVEYQLVATKAVTNLDETDDFFNLSSHGYSTGDKVFFYGITLPSNIQSEIAYYVIEGSNANRFSVAATYADAIAGTPKINLIGTACDLVVARVGTTWTTTGPDVDFTGWSTAINGTAGSSVSKALFARSTDTVGNLSSVKACFVITDQPETSASIVSSGTIMFPINRVPVLITNPNVVASSSSAISWIKYSSILAVSTKTPTLDFVRQDHEQLNELLAIHLSTSELTRNVSLSPAALHAQVVARAQNSITQRTPQSQPAKTVSAPRTSSTPKKPVSPPAESAENSGNGANTASASGSPATSSSSASGLTPAAAPVQNGPGNPDSPQAPRTPAAPGAVPVNSAMPFCMPRGSKEEETE